MRISPADALSYWAHPSQQVFGKVTALPDDPFEYWASGPFCAAVYPTMMRGVWGVDFAVMPEAKGRYVAHARGLIMDFWREKSPSCLVGHTLKSLRPALAFIRRVGFVEVGEITGDLGPYVISKFGVKEWELIR